MTIFRFRSAHWESLWTLTRQRQWPHCLSGRLSSCGSSCGLFGGGSADIDESYELLAALKRRLWRLLKADRPISHPPHRTNALARSECPTTKGLHCRSRW